MTIQRISAITRNLHTREIDVTDDQLESWAKGALIQDVMPHLSPDDREFIMTGITPEEWLAFNPPPAEDFIW